ncbi:MAG: hypothetical protein ISS28_04945 [Candidatus Cloacimonetes bacterium]|nr:hypothetical protein [Candidatus Cloacimonadota bacterium]
MQEKEINLIDYWNIIWKKRKFIVISLIIVSIITAGISFLLPKWYRAQAVIMPPSEDSGSFGSHSAGLTSFSLGGLFGDNSDQQRIIAILRSRTLLQSMDEKFDFQTKYKKKFKFQTYEELRSNLRFEIGEQNQIVISFIDKDQNAVSDMLKYALSCLDSLNISLSQKRANSQRQFIEERIFMIQDSLSNLENTIADFMKGSNVISIPDQVTSAIFQAAELKAKITAYEIELTIKKDYISDSRPEVERLEKEISLLKDSYKIFFTNNEDKLYINLDNIPELELEYLQLKRKVQYFEKLLEFLGPQYEQAKIEEVKDTPTIQIIDEPERPEWKYKPKRALLVVQTDFVFAFLIIIFILIKERKKYFDE